MARRVQRLLPIALPRSLQRRPLVLRAMATNAKEFYSTSRQQVLVFADFDQTITTRDTIGLLFEAARTKRTDTAQRAVHEHQVDKLVELFFHDNQVLVLSAVADASVEDGKATAVNDFNELGLRRFLDDFAVTDMRSIQRVIDSKTLSMLTSRDLMAIGDQVDVMDGCVETLLIPSPVYVLSSNWSQTMIREKLLSLGLSHIQVAANELKMDKHGVTTGDIDLVVQAPTDKAAFVANQQAITSAHDGGIVSVFIGDSTNDLLAMLQADVGITLAFAVDSTFARVCCQFGIQLVALSTHKSTLCSCKAAARNAKQSGVRVIFTANSWHEIRAILVAD